MQPLTHPELDRVVRALEDGFDVFRRECDALEVDDFCRWPTAAAFQGDWFLYPLVSREAALHLGCDLAAHRRRCPDSARILASLPLVVEAGFSRLEPNTHIYPHHEELESARQRIHLGLRIPDGALLRVGGETGTWREGRCRVFDGHVEHEAANLGATPRTILLCDVARAGPVR